MTKLSYYHVIINLALVVQIYGSDKYKGLLTWERSYHFGETSYLVGVNIIPGMYQKTILKLNVSSQLPYMHDIIKPSAFTK